MFCVYSFVSLYIYICIYIYIYIYVCSVLYICLLIYVLNCAPCQAETARQDRTADLPSKARR